VLFHVHNCYEEKKKVTKEYLISQLSITSGCARRTAIEIIDSLITVERLVEKDGLIYEVKDFEDEKINSQFKSNGLQS